MKQEQILKLLNSKQESAIQRMDEDLVGVMEEEFVLTNVLKSYLEYLKKNKHSNWRNYKESMQELLSQHDVLIKKTNGFDISKHNEELGMYLHKHTYFELDYVYKGSCEYYINGSKQMFILKEKQACMVNPNILHAIKTNDKNDIVFKCFIPIEQIKPEYYRQLKVRRSLRRFFEQSLKEETSYSAYIIIDVKENKSIEKILFQLLEESIEQKENWKNFYQSYLSLLLLEFTRISEENFSLVCEESKEEETFIKVLEMIKKNYPSITLRDLAKDFHFNENYLSRKIKQETHMGFHELIHQYRLLEAEQLIINTQLTIGEIASRVGYEKPNYFYKIFKKQYGKTPIEYKNERIGKR